mgnify:CR=1 FL=1
MLILTHEGPGFRSPLMARDAAVSRAQSLQQDPQYAAVKALESTRAKHPANRFFVLCLPACERQRAELLAQFQEERLRRAEQEGPQYVWVPDPQRPVWQLVTVAGSVYEVDNHGQSCTCPDFGVCQDNSLRCKHLIAFEQGLGSFLTLANWDGLRLLAERASSGSLPMPPERQPVALPVAA